jgi:hypothetical protein
MNSKLVLSILTPMLTCHISLQIVVELADGKTSQDIWDDSFQMIYILKKFILGEI